MHLCLEVIQITNKNFSIFGQETHICMKFIINQSRIASLLNAKRKDFLKIIKRVLVNCCAICEIKSVNHDYKTIPILSQLSTNRISIYNLE